jgi:hypothetical protein
MSVAPTGTAIVGRPAPRADREHEDDQRPEALEHGEVVAEEVGGLDGRQRQQSHDCKVVHRENPPFGGLVHHREPLDVERLRHRVARRRRRRRLAAVAEVAMAMVLGGAAGAVLTTGDDDQRVDIVDRPPDGPTVTRPAPPTTAAAAGRSRLVDIRVEAQESVERVIFECSGGLPSPRDVTAANAPTAAACPEVPRVEGDAFLNVVISSYLPDGQVDEGVPRRVAGPPGGIVTEVAVACAALSSALHLVAVT